MRSGIITYALSLGYDITWTTQTHLFILCVPNNFFIKANFQLIVNVFHCGKKSTFNFNMLILLFKFSTTSLSILSKAQFGG